MNDQTKVSAGSPPLTLELDQAAAARNVQEIRLELRVHARATVPRSARRTAAPTRSSTS